MAGSDSHVKKSCACCKRYWGHLGGKMNCFLRRMIADYRNSMIVPTRFVNHFGGKISGTIKLESPNGIIYLVEVTEHMNSTVLGCGWEAFVDAHHIEENDSLLFHHIENSRFKVLILDSDGCEKVFSCTGMGNKCSHERTVESVGISNSSHDDTAKSSGSKSFARRESGSSSEKSAKLAATSSSSEKSEEEDSPSDCRSLESDDLVITPGRDYVLPHKSSLDEKQKKEVVALIHEIQSKITVYVAIMGRPHVQPERPFLSIEKEYAVAHFPLESATITLQRPGDSKKWHPTFYKREHNGMNMLRGRWLDFVCDNCVQEGDICIFVPAKGGRRFTFTVHLLPNKTTHCRGGTGVKRIDSSHGRKDERIASAVNIEQPADGENVSSENDMDDISHESLETEDCNGPSKTPYILPLRIRLSQSQKKVIEEKVQEIESEVPIYVAIMKKGNIGAITHHRLQLGSEYAAAYLPNRKQTVVLQCMGKIWKTNMLMTNNGKRRYIAGGWAKFVGDNSLQLGDICLFELKKKERNLTLAVHLLRKTSIDHSLGGSPVLGSNSHRASTSMVSTLRVKEEPDDGEEATSLEHEEHGFSEDPLELDDSNGVSELPYMLPTKVRLTPVQEKQVLAKVGAIQSELHIYITVINKTNLQSGYLILATQYAAAYLKGSRSLVLQWEGDSRAWNAKILDSNRTLKIGSGWSSFARDNRLQEGDLCLFQLMKNKERLKMMVYIIPHDQCHIEGMGKLQSDI